jgi:biopolymer transport protein ExbB/TolQ
VRSELNIIIEEHWRSAALGLIAYAICVVAYTILTEDNTQDANSVLYFHQEMQKNAHKNPAVV